MSQSKLQVAAQLKIYINNSLFGRATGFEFSVSPNNKNIYGLDSVEAYELATTVYTVKGRIDCIRISGDGGLEGSGIAAPQSKILYEKYISITIVDRKTDQVVFQCDKAKVTGQTWSASAKRRVEGNFTFEGISWYNESQS